MGISQKIDKWLEKNGGARRFDRGFSVDPDYIRDFLESRGCQVRTRAGYYYVSSKNFEKTHCVRWRGLVALVDELRMAEGDEPIIKRVNGQDGNVGQND